MQLAQLLAAAPLTADLSGSGAIEVTQITSDSRQVSPGALFVAYHGLGADGHRFIPDAIARGAVAVVGELALEHPLPVTYVQVADGRSALAWLSAAWYGHPSRSMHLVGITGTDGKTTTASLLYAILSAARFRTGMISTVSAVIGEQTYETGLHTTTPDAPDVQRYLAQMRDAQTQVGVLEVTSHGLAQHRVTGCAFDVAVITNITHEHLDFHGSYEAYRTAKGMLFRGLSEAAAHKPGLARLPKTMVLNRDDASYPYLSAIPAERTISYSLSAWTAAPEGPGAAGDLALTGEIIRQTATGMEIRVHLGGAHSLQEISAFPVKTPLVGVFNVSNILAAAGAALAVGTGVESIQRGVAAVSGVPGRMERIDAGQAFVAIVDFAHTPNALAMALKTARTVTAGGGRVIAVFGSAGLRDREKRRMMGEVAAALADYTVVTAEDPRTEDLDAIIADTAAALAAGGRHEGVDYVRVADRQRALQHAVQLAAPGDVVIVCGKGHEQSMCFGTKEYPWRDQDALRWALEALRASGPPPPFKLPTYDD